MGLDQFGTIRKPGSQDKIEIAYWRKHPQSSRLDGGSLAQ